jgi:uncharacterized protein (DUF302 family)
MERTIEVRHVSLEVNADFESFTRELEQSIGHLDPSIFKDLEKDPAGVERRINELAGEAGLMHFGVQDHGTLLKLAGTPRKAKQYVIGNPLIAITMTRHDIRAGLYAPLRVLVYEADNRSTQVEFDQPSSLFGQFQNPQVTAVGQSLDTKLANVIKKAELSAQQTWTAAPGRNP